MILKNGLLQPNNWIDECFFEGLVSVIIPTFNRGYLLDEAIRSVFEQSYRPIEVIVVDDGSIDNTEAIIKKWHEQSVSEIGISIDCIRQSNKGAPVARNRGVKASRGEYIQFLDSDDFLMPDKISDAVDLFVNEQNLDFVYSLRGEFMDDPTDFKKWERRIADLEQDLSPAEIVLNNIWTALPLFSRQIINMTGPWNEELYAFQDWEYIARVAYWAKKVKVVYKIQALCRTHNGGRISVNSWGNALGVKANAEASLALYPYVSTCESNQRKEAVTALAKRSLSSLRVAVVAGHINLGRMILKKNRAVLASRKKIWRESLIWYVILFFPELFLRFLFYPLRLFKQSR